MVRYETLKKFCSTDILRESLQFVKRIDNNWYASDGHVACRVSEEAKHSDDILYLTEYPNDLRYPNIEAVLPETVSDNAIQMSVKEIKNSFQNLRKVREHRDVEEEIHYKECDCNDCYGGKVTLTESVIYKGHYYDLEEEVDCPVCHGHGVIPDIEDYDPDEDDYDPETDKTHIVSKWTGRMIPDFESAIEIHGITVKAKYLKLMTEVAEEMGTDTVSVDRKNDMLIVGMKGVLIGIMKCQK